MVCGLSLGEGKETYMVVGDLVERYTVTQEPAYQRKVRM